MVRGVHSDRGMDRPRARVIALPVPFPDRLPMAGRLVRPALPWWRSSWFLAALENLLVVVALLGAFLAGFIYAGLVDPDGWLLRVTLGWLVGEFR